MKLQYFLILFLTFSCHSCSNPRSTKVIQNKAIDFICDELLFEEYFEGTTDTLAMFWGRLVSDVDHLIDSFNLDKHQVRQVSPSYDDILPRDGIELVNAKTSCTATHPAIGMLDLSDVFYSNNQAFVFYEFRTLPSIPCSGGILLFEYDGREWLLSDRRITLSC